MNQNIEITGIETDAALATILSNFSDDYIEDLIVKAFEYKFRPYGIRMPNYAKVFEQNYIGIKDNYFGPTPEVIDDDREETYKMLIRTICNVYNLQITEEIPAESLYPLAYSLCDLLLSDFTTNLINFFSNYVINNAEGLLNAIPEESRINKSTYTKKVYPDPVKAAVYENIAPILDIIAGLDINFETLLTMIIDTQTAQFISNYISDCGDIYRNHFASYILQPETRAQMITIIKINFANLAMGQSENPFI